MKKRKSPFSSRGRKGGISSKKKWSANIVLWRGLLAAPQRMGRRVDRRYRKISSLDLFRSKNRKRCPLRRPLKEGGERKRVEVRGGLSWQGTTLSSMREERGGCEIEEGFVIMMCWEEKGSRAIFK